MAILDYYYLIDILSDNAEFEYGHGHTSGGKQPVA